MYFTHLLFKSFISDTEAEQVKPTKTTTSTGTSPPPQSISTQVRQICLNTLIVKEWTKTC